MAAGRQTPPVLAPLLRPDFRLFFAGRTISLLGTSMAPVALAFAVLDAAHRAGDLGVVFAARVLPMVFVLLGGAVADRFSRRTVLALASLGSALTQGTVATVLLTGHYRLAVVAAAEFVAGVLDGFASPALRGVLPQLVDPPLLRQANALLSGTRNATKVLGPSLSGLLVVAVGSAPAIAFDAATYLVAAVLVARVRLAAPVRAERSTLLADVRTGWTAFRSIPWVWPVTLAFGFANLVQAGTWGVLGPLLTRQVAGTATWGFMLSTRGAGMLVCSALMYRIVVRHLLRLGQATSALFALPLVALGLHAHAPWLVATAFLAGMGSALGGIAWDTSLQEHVPGDVLSRVVSYDELLSYLAIPIGALAVGPLSDASGGFAVATASGLLFTVLALCPLASRAVRDLPSGSGTRRSSPTTWTPGTGPTRRRPGSSGPPRTVRTPGRS